MKYFVNACEREASGHENYIEFMIANSTKKFWDEESLYMLESTMKETGFDVFWYECMLKDLVFDMDSISQTDIKRMASAAVKYGGTILEVMNELKPWVEEKLAQGNRAIYIERAEDLALEYRGVQDEVK